MSTFPYIQCPPFSCLVIINTWLFDFHLCKAQHCMRTQLQKYSTSLDTYSIRNHKGNRLSTFQSVQRTFHRIPHLTGHEGLQKDTGFPPIAMRTELLCHLKPLLAVLARLPCLVITLIVLSSP
ncbi:hypothetical protein EV401DRAFT_1920107 [Pisolithus croceorrhizus]|nr:hypothetical protein EV401DRAFT_1920107 [Pisolithus croceorrhizus]